MVGAATTGLGLSILTCTSSIFAILWGMKRNVETQSSIRRVRPPEKREMEQIDQAVEAKILKPRSGLARLIPNRTQMYLLGEYTFFALAAYIVSRYGTTLITDIVFGAIEACLLSFVYQHSISSIHPVPTLLRYRYPNDLQRDMFVLEESPEEDISFFQKGWPRTGLGILCAALTLLALALGYRPALALVSTAWLLTGMSAFVGPIMSIRGYVFVLLILQAVPVAVVGILAVHQYFHPSGPDVSTRGTGFGRPSPWLSDLVEYHMWTMVTLMPAGLICLTNRFEHFSCHASPAETTSPGAHLSIERGRPCISKRSSTSATSFGLLSYATGLLVYVSLMQLYKGNRDMIDRVGACGYVFTTSSTILGICLAIYFQGRWSEWWAYYEQWKTGAREMHYEETDKEHVMAFSRVSQTTECKQYPVI